MDGQTVLQEIASARMPLLIIINIIITIHKINNIKSWPGYNVVCTMYIVYALYMAWSGEYFVCVECLEEREREVAYLLFIFCNQSIISNQLSSEN